MKAGGAVRRPLQSQVTGAQVIEEEEMRKNRILDAFGGGTPSPDPSPFPPPPTSLFFLPQTIQVKREPPSVPHA